MWKWMFRLSAEPPDERHRPGSGAGRDGESCFLDEVGGDGAVDHAEHLAHYLGPGGEQEA